LNHAIEVPEFGAVIDVYTKLSIRSLFDELFKFFEALSHRMLWDIGMGDFDYHWSGKCNWSSQKD
jgi:hypothetical protein